MPERIQLRRTKGWRMPANTVKVDRTTRWGNPFTLDLVDRETSLKMYRDMVTGFFSPSLLKHLSDDDFKVIYDGKQRFWHRNGAHPYWPLIRGKNLACWCALDQPCHADVLLELANPPVLASPAMTERAACAVPPTDAQAAFSPAGALLSGRDA